MAGSDWTVNLLLNEHSQFGSRVFAAPSSEAVSASLWPLVTGSFRRRLYAETLAVFTIGGLCDNGRLGLWHFLGDGLYLNWVSEWKLLSFFHFAQIG